MLLGHAPLATPKLGVVVLVATGGATVIGGVETVAHGDGVDLTAVVVLCLLVSVFEAVGELDDWAPTETLLAELALAVLTP